MISSNALDNSKDCIDLFLFYGFKKIRLRVASYLVVELKIQSLICFSSLFMSYFLYPICLPNISFLTVIIGYFVIKYDIFILFHQGLFLKWAAQDGDWEAWVSRLDNLKVDGWSPLCQVDTIISQLCVKSCREGHLQCPLLCFSHWRNASLSAAKPLMFWLNHRQISHSEWAVQLQLWHPRLWCYLLLHLQLDFH